MRLTAVSKKNLAQARAASFQACTDGVADSWVLVWLSLPDDVWDVCLHTPDGPAMFPDEATARSFLSKKGFRGDFRV